MDIHLRELRYFVAVAEELHFTRAAQRLYVSQPALSKQIRALEGQLGVALFERDRRAVRLTEAGAALLPLAQEVLETWREAELAVAERAATAAAVLRVGFLTRVGRGVLPAVQAAFAEAHPAWQLQLRHADWQDPTGGLADGTSDVAVVWLPLPDARAFAHHVVATEPRWVAMSAEHALAARASIDFAELLDEPFLALPAAAGVARDFWLAVEERGGRPVRIAAEVASADETFEALLTERAVVLLASGNADLYDRPGVVARPVIGIGPCRLVVAWRADDERVTVRAFVEACRRLSDDAQAGAVAS
jgi:DNA-binding transcriptional LysR family regulator